ncbi:MAG TPA: hypothetical protein VHL60_12990 [Oxalicibacterium sp.]|jgi:hypothetical protein|nr:hypothetical protein [Oxalicibacterium sp.]
MRLVSSRRAPYFVIAAILCSFSSPSFAVESFLCTGDPVFARLLH